MVVSPARAFGAPDEQELGPAAIRAEGDGHRGTRRGPLGVSRERGTAHQRCLEARDEPIHPRVASVFHVAAGMAAEHWLRRDSDAGSSSGPSWDAQAAGPELDLSGGSSDNWDTGGGVDMGGGGGDW